MRRNLGEQTVAFRFYSQLLRLLHIVFGWGYFPFRRGRKGNKFLFHLQLCPPFFIFHSSI